MILEGRCHCGAVHAAFETALDPDVIQVRACQCAFCRPRGARTVSDPAGRLTLRFDEADVSRYRFASRTVDFLVCRTCGAFVGVVQEGQDGVVGVLNAAGVGLEVLALRAAEPFNYDAESPDQKQARRRSRWTPVTIEGVAA